MDIIITQITTLSTQNDSDLKKLKDFLRHEQETLKNNASQIDQALQMLHPVQNTLGIAFLLSAQVSAGVYADQKKTFTYIGSFLRQADMHQARKASVPVIAICKSFVQMAIEDGQRSMLRCLVPLRCALEKLRPNEETLTPVHAEFLRVCLKCKAYHMGAQLLEQPIFDISAENQQYTYPQMTPQNFLCYYYYGALIRIGRKEYSQAMQLLLVALTCPASCLSAIQADAYKKFALVSLKVSGELQQLPVYASHIVQRYAKSPSYVLEIAEAFKQGDLAALERIAEEKATQIQADGNAGLVGQVIASLRRHKVQMLTKTYLTLSLAEIAKEIGVDEANVGEIEALLFDMISSGDVRARIDRSTGNVSFEDEEDEMDAAMVNKMQDKLQQIMGLAGRIAAFEQEVVSSEAYIRKTVAVEGSGGAGGVPGMGDFMDT